MNTVYNLNDLDGFQADLFGSLTMEELSMIDGGGFFEGLGYAAGYVVGAVREIVGGMYDAARD